MKSIRRVFLMMIVALLLADVSAWAEPDSSSHPAPPARLGDLIIRHRGETLGIIGTKPGDPFPAVPHIGLFIGDRVTHNVVHIKNENNQAIIRPGFWQSQGDFQDGAFYSLLDSTIPVRYQGRIIPMRDLPEGFKDDIRGRVCTIAEVERTGLRSLGRFKGSQFNGSGHSRNCGDWALGLYDRVFRSMNLDVMAHKLPDRLSPEEWLRNPGLLKTGHLQNYAEILFGTVDPSRLAGWCPRVAPPASSTIPNYWVSPGMDRSMAEANTVPAFVRGKNRALIVGDGKEAQHMYQTTSRLLGADNVKWIKSGGQPVDWERAARLFKADIVMGEKSVTANTLSLAANTFQTNTGDSQDPKSIFLPVSPVPHPRKETASGQRNHFPPPSPFPPGNFPGPSRRSQMERIPGEIQTPGRFQSNPLPSNPASGHGQSGALPPQKVSLGSSGSVQAPPDILGPNPSPYKRGPSHPGELPSTHFPSGIGSGSVNLPPPMMHNTHSFSPSFSAPSTPSMPSMPSTRFR